MSDDLHSRILGCMVGSAIGDAFGGPVEFLSGEELEALTGKCWVDEFLPYPVEREPHPLGIWSAGAPRGTGTDDTRNNHIFAECVIRNRGTVDSHLLAIEYIQRYRDRELFYPDHVELAERQYRWMHERSCAYLGMRELPSGAPAWAVSAYGSGRPTLAGLISLAFAGLLYQEEPEQAYVKAFELSFLDLGYARDATAMMAAMVSAALGGGVSGREMVNIGLETNPFGLGETVFAPRVLVEEIGELLQLCSGLDDDKALIDALAHEVASRHPYDPIDILGVPMAAIHHCDGDPVRSIIMAANDRGLTDDGGLAGLRDVDCTAGVAGALVGALHGVEAFPQDWVADAMGANRETYGIDLAENASRFCEAVYGANS